MKTTFVDGITVLTAAFANHIFRHVHDGSDVDGSAAKIHPGNSNIDWQSQDLNVTFGDLILLGIDTFRQMGFAGLGGKKSAIQLDGVFTSGIFGSGGFTKLYAPQIVDKIRGTVNQVLQFLDVANGDTITVQAFRFQSTELQAGIAQVSSVSSSGDVATSGKFIGKGAPLALFTVRKVGGSWEIGKDYFNSVSSLAISSGADILRVTLATALPYGSSTPVFVSAPETALEDSLNRVLTCAYRVISSTEIQLSTFTHTASATTQSDGTFYTVLIPNV
jgi:hypothetical protein